MLNEYGKPTKMKLTATQVKAVRTPEKNPLPRGLILPVFGTVGIWSLPYFWKVAKLRATSLFR